MKNLSNITILLILILIIEFGIIIHLKQENEYLDNMHKFVISNIMKNSFKLGCLEGSEHNIFICEELTRTYELNGIPNLELGIDD